jgi:hypothetical protein
MSPPITSPPALPTPTGDSPTLESLRADIRYLLGQFYLYYALLPYREGFRDEITRRARNLTYIFLGIFAFVIFLASIETYLKVWGQYIRVPIILIVVLSGVVGGCISMLQRIQSAPAEGDALFNLASLTNGWKGMSLSPLHGAVFAVLFYMLFAGGIVNGVVFPAIKTPDDFATPTPTPTPTPTQTTPTQQQPPANETAQQDQTTPPAQTSQKNCPPCNENRPASIFWRFTDGTYPESGKAFALLILWSFLAGFLERLVPDALNRLVAKTEIIQGTKT